MGGDEEDTLMLNRCIRLPHSSMYCFRSHSTNSNTSVSELGVWMMSCSVTMFACFSPRSSDTASRAEQCTLPAARNANNAAQELGVVRLPSARSDCREVHECEYKYKYEHAILNVRAAHNSGELVSSSLQIKQSCDFRVNNALCLLVLGACERITCSRHSALLMMPLP